MPRCRCTGACTRARWMRTKRRLRRTRCRSALVLTCRCNMPTDPPPSDRGDRQAYATGTVHLGWRNPYAIAYRNINSMGSILEGGASWTCSEFATHRPAEGSRCLRKKRMNTLARSDNRTSPAYQSPAKRSGPKRSCICRAWEASPLCLGAIRNGPSAPSCLMGSMSRGSPRF
jgi:hypothetical protein